MEEIGAPSIKTAASAVRSCAPTETAERSAVITTAARVNDPAAEHIGILPGSNIKAIITVTFCNARRDLGGSVPRVLREGAQRGFERGGKYASTGLFVTGQTGAKLSDTREGADIRRAAAGEHSAICRSVRSLERALGAGSEKAAFSIGSGSDTELRGAPGEARNALAEPLVPQARYAQA